MSTYISYIIYPKSFLRKTFFGIFSHIYISVPTRVHLCVHCSSDRAVILQGLINRPIKLNRIKLKFFLNKYRCRSAHLCTMYSYDFSKILESLFLKTLLTKSKIESNRTTTSVI